jgi:translation elongation factor EF-G
MGVLLATAPLARLLGYSRSLAQLTAGTAQGVLCLSHYDNRGRESIE